MSDDFKIRGSAGEAKELAAYDKARRERAPRILNPSEIRGEYDASRLLQTTLGGIKREITLDDLAAFRRNAELVGKLFKGGITPRQIIDHSLSIDRERARKQIKWSIPSYSQASRADNLIVRFITDASQLYQATRHHVVVEFLGYQNAVVSGAYSSQRAAREMSKGQIRFDCDCGRHTFWYRYIATIGNYNYGRKETGYPKIRNPMLVGIACKHVLRVMAEIEGGAYLLSFLTQAIEKARKSSGANVKTQMTQKEATKNIAKQNSRKVGGIDSRDERDLHRARIALRKQVQNTRKKMPKPKVMAGGSRKIDKLKGVNSKPAEAVLMQTIQSLGLNRDQALAILKKMNS